MDDLMDDEPFNLDSVGDILLAETLGGAEEADACCPCWCGCWRPGTLNPSSADGTECTDCLAGRHYPQS